MTSTELTADTEAVAARHGTGMLRRYGWLYRVLAFGSRLARVRFEDHSAERVRDAANRGPVVYVLQHASGADHLALNSVLNRRRLPLSVWSNGANSFWWQPVVDAWRDLWHRLTSEREDPVRSGWLASTLRDGHTCTVFLNTSPSPLRRMRGETLGDPFEAILDAQRESDRPIQVLPVVVTWTRAPIKSGQAVRSFLLGRSEAPGLLGQLRNIWTRSENAVVSTGEPVDVATFLERARPDEAPRALRRVLRRYLRRESQIFKGPKLLPYNEMQRVVLENPAMREFVADEVKRSGQTPERVWAQVDKEYRQIASNFRWWVVRTADVVLRPLWTRVFSGVDVRPEDIERIRAAMRNGTPVLLPCHKSHFDYILITWAFYEHELIIPHVVAGANLNIFGLSTFFRSVGGFFIKRSFSGERIHPVVFSRYLRELIYQGYPLEFYLEGGRTRSGKLLSPRVGVLGMVLDAAEKRPTDHEVTLLPISLAYEQVAEEGSYVREAGGAEKQAESVGQLVKARSVLSRRFGRVYLRVGEPILASDLVDESDERPGWSERSESERKETLHTVGERVIHRIGRVTVVLPTCLCAAGLLAHHRRGVRQDDLLERLQRFRVFLQARGAMEAASLEHYDQAIRAALDRFTRAGHIEALEHDGTRIWSMVPDHRIHLEFYKNQLLHFFAPAGFVTLVMRALPEGPLAFEDLVEPLEALCALWKREFRFDPDLERGDLLQQGLHALEGHGAVTQNDGMWQVVDPERMGEIYALFRNFAEAYLVVLRSADELDGHDKKSFSKHLASKSEALLAAGVVTRPESLSTITLGNAVSAFLDREVFVNRDGKLEVGEKGVADDVAMLAAMVE